MSNPFQAVLEAVHELYEKNTDYPDISSEDFIVRRRIGNNGINEFEKEAKDGVAWSKLKKDASFPAGGTGTDSLTTNVPDFLKFLRGKDNAEQDLPALISNGSSKWIEVSMKKGNRMIQEGISDAYAFWVEAGNIRTLPAMSGTMQFPYLRKANRYPIGTEATPLDMSDIFLQEYIIAYLYLDDENLSAYQAHMQTAKDNLDSDRNNEISDSQDDSGWGFGM